MTRMQGPFARAPRLGFVGLLTGSLSLGPSGAGGGDRGEPAAREDAAVAVTAPGARACDLLFDGGDETIAEVRFEGVEGRYYQRPPRMGVSFAVLADAPLPAEPLTLAGGAHASLSTAVCYDRAGQPIERTSVEVGR